jgi:hypothetical protein
MMPSTPRATRGVPYRTAIDSLHRLYLILIRISEVPRLPQAVRTELRIEVSILAALLSRDNGRRR